jgi:hypothetical protein
MLRHLRFVPAVAFALLAVAFVGLWVRSYQACDCIRYIPSRDSAAITTSYKGMVWLMAFEAVPLTGELGWSLSSDPATDDLAGVSATGGLGFSTHRSRRVGRVSIPYWFLTLLSLGLAALFAFKPITRFTVRGLLLTTTLLAAVLGAVVYAI